MRRSQAVKAEAFESSIVRPTRTGAIYATVVELTYTSILGVDAERLASLNLACGTTVIEWLRTVLLISFDCHYYSRLASDGAVVLCKLGDCAAMVLVVSTSAFQAERAGSSPVGCSNLVWVGFLAVKSGCACARYHPERG